MIEITIRPGPVLRWSVAEQGWHAQVTGSHIQEKALGHNETLGKVLVSLIADGAVDIAIIEED